jgi:hypothetical protein
MAYGIKTIRASRVRWKLWKPYSQSEEIPNQKLYCISSEKVLRLVLIIASRSRGCGGDGPHLIFLQFT